MQLRQWQKQDERGLARDPCRMLAIGTWYVCAGIRQDLRSLQKQGLTFPRAILLLRQSLSQANARKHATAVALVFRRSECSKSL